MSSPASPRAFRLHPDSVLGDRRLLSRTLAGLYLAAPLVVLVWLAVAGSSHTSTIGLLVVAGLAIFAGAVFLTGVFESRPPWTLQAAMAVATLLISAAIYFSDDADSEFAFFYLWSTPYAFCFFTRRQTALQMVLLGASFAAALAARGRAGMLGDICVRWFVVVGTVLIVGLLVRLLTESLRDSDVRFQRGFEAAHIGMALLTPDGRWLQVNPALCDFLGRSADELLGHPVSEMVHPDDSAPSPQAIALRDEDTGIASSSEKRFLRAGGELVWAEFSVSRVPDPAGRARYLFAQVQDVTERKAARERLAHRERQLAEAGRIASLGSWEWDIVHDVATWSDEVYRLFGLERGEFGGNRDSFLARVHPDDRERVMRDSRAALSSAGPHSNEYRIVRPDGEVRVMHARSEAEIGSGGAPVRLIGAIQDITERKAEEEKLAKNERALAEAQRLAQLGSWEWDRASGTVSGSPEMLRILGLPARPSAVHYHQALEVVHPDDRQAVDAVLRESGESGEPFSLVFRIVRPDGEVRVLHARGEPQLGPDGAVRRMFGTHQDISDRRAAEDALRRAEQRFRALLDAAPDAIVGVDDEGRIVLANAQVERLTGYSPEELNGQYAAAIAPPSARTEYVRRHLSFFDGRGLDTSEREFIIRRKDGSEFPCEVAFSTLESDEGVLAVAAIRDITERKRAREMEAQLEARLHQSERLESVGQLAGGIAHDFNNLLAVIMSYARVLREELSDDHRLGEEVREIERAADRAAELTHQLLIFSRRDKAEPTPLDLNSIAGATERLLRRTLGEHVQLSTHYAPDVWPVLADAGQIEQVLVNLAVNARDAMSEGGKLTIETANVELGPDEARELLGGPGGRYVRLTVSDTGAGMSEEVEARAFEPFFSTKRVGEGTGLGLASVYGIVTQAGGHIELESEPEAGTTVTVHLPATTVATAEVASPARPVEIDSLEGTGETVLVVEDEDAVRNLARRILLRHGYDVVPADGVRDALRTVERHNVKIDLLLTDVVMPEMSGRELAARAVDLRPEMRVLFMSGYMSEVVALQGVANGPAHFLGKPFTPEALLRTVREALAGS